MKKFLTSLALALFAAAPISAQQEGSMRDIVRIGNASYMIVFPFESHAQYAEFSNNKKILLGSYKEMNEIKLKAESEKDEKKREALGPELAHKTEAFQTNDKAMTRGYNYTATRDYAELFLKSNICVPISDEEFSVLRFKDGTKIDPLQIVGSGTKRFYRIKTIEGFQENQNFQGILAGVLARRVEIAKLREQIAEQTDMAKINEITKKIADAEKDLKEKISLLKTKYGLDSDTKYMIEIEKARLLLKLKPEELMQLEASQKK